MAPELLEHQVAKTSNGQPKVSTRSKLVSSGSGPPGIVQGVDPHTNFQRCEDEPIHTPGAIQSVGALIGLRYNDLGDLEVQIASENTRKIIGYGPEQLFALNSFLDVLKDEVRDEMVARVNHTLHDSTATNQETRLDVFKIILTFSFEPDVRLWCAMHHAPEPEGLVICEFEEYHDAFMLRDIRAAGSLPETPISSMEVSPEELARSSTSKSRPLPVINVARQRKNKEFSSLDLFNALSQAQKQISWCTSVQNVLEIVVGIVAELTGFHRVMVYRFDSQKNGCVDAELVNPQASTDVWLGLNYPSSDIPQQARELYVINRIRLLHDREAETSRLVCRNERDFEKPLNLTHAYLRAMSPVHNKYLANMGVRSTMSISIVIDGDLWGLIACHGYGDVGIKVSLPIRELCRNIGECVAFKIQQLLMKKRIDARRAPMPTPSRNNAGFIAASSSDLLKLVDAEFAILSVDDDARAIGRLDPYQEAIAITSYLQTCKFTSIRASDNISADFPAIASIRHIKTIAGFLLVPLNFGGGNDCIVFFRKGQTKQVKWAGNPHEKKFRSTEGEYLEPRASFQRWVDTVSGTSREWTEDQIDTASVLGLLYGRFIEVWRQKGSAKQANQISQIRASSRELRTPLNAIVNYLEMALENRIDDKTRHILDRAQEASTSLGYVMEDLLKLTKPEDTPTHGADETFNLSLTVSRAMKGLQKDASCKNLDMTVSLSEQLPRMVKGGLNRFKEVLQHLTSYAYRQSRSINVQIDLIGTHRDTSTIGFTIRDNGPGLSESELDDVFQELEQAQDDDDWLFATNDSEPAAAPPGPRADLAIVARYIRDVNGQIRLSSEPGRGTIFRLEIPFTHAQSCELSRSRKFKSLFSPSLASHRGLSPPSPPPPVGTPKLGLSAGKRAEVAGPSLNHAERTLGPGPDSPRHVPSIELNGRPEASTRVVSNGRSSRSDTNSGPHTETDSMDPVAAGPTLTVLIAEDNIVSQKMLGKKIATRGHDVLFASDGQEAHDRFAASGGRVDIILMDLKMPSVDGALATRMIRFYEKESSFRAQQATGRDSQTPRPRVPILAMSAQLFEDHRFEYIQTGFDGWIVKPLDFQRLDLILQGVKNAGAKRESLYVPGQWEKGGWFFP
ncbi:Histidine kinase osmosensor [Diplocarpon rosae]|nr:Histidine kinase osmosensor [Diplocarpon rosae]